MIHDCIDLHTHSNASDGSDSPRDVVRKAAAAGLKVIALTDHDTLDGLDEAEDEARKQGLTFVRGCEISTATPWGEAHFLGLWIPRGTEATKRLERSLNEIRQKRLERNLRIADRLRALGFNVSYEQAAELAGGRIVGRPHFAELLCLLGVAKDRKEAFRTYLGRDGLAFVPRELPTPQEAIAMLKDAGALVSMAHPRLLRASVAELGALLAKIAPCGLDALEAYHSEHDAGDVRECVDLADRFGLQLTGGSDYHGLAKPNIALGHGKGGLRVRLHVYDALMSYRRRCGLGA